MATASLLSAVRASDDSRRGHSGQRVTMTSPSRAVTMARRCESRRRATRQGLLQKLDLLLVGPHDPEVAQRPGAQGGGGQPLGRRPWPRQHGRPLEVVVGQRLSPARFCASAKAISASQRAGDRQPELLGHLQAAGEMDRRFLERQQAQGRSPAAWQ